MSHLTLSDRIKIESGLNEEKTLNQIAKEVNKSLSTISREIRKNLIIVDKGAAYRIKNRCIHRNSCSNYGICEDKPDCTRKCSTCSNCNTYCNNFVEERCKLLLAKPYVCNGCKRANACVLMKAYYYANKAEKKYRELLSEVRKGYNMSMSEIKQIDKIVSPLLKSGQSIHNICTNNSDKLTVSESTISRLIKDNMLNATVFDQARVVKLKPRKGNKNEKKVDKKCRLGRTIEDYHKYMSEHPEAVEVEMDTVIGKPGGKCLLTIIFPSSALMLAFLCEAKTAFCTQSKFEFLYENLGIDFNFIFEVILTDNGSEFSNPHGIEIAPNNSIRSHVFYCDPNSAWQKPHVERNHEFIRKIVPKGSTFNNLTQEKVGLMMSHINSYKRSGLGDRSPFEVFAFLYGETLLNKLLHLTCQQIISPNEIILKPKLLK